MQARQTRPLKDFTRVLRSKNAGPFLTTMDAFFHSADAYEHVRQSGAVTKSHIARQLGIEPADIVTLTFYKPALGLKITIKKPDHVASGDHECSDTFGAQQYVPLRDLPIPVNEEAPAAP